MRIKLIPLFTLLLLGFTIKQYQLALKYKKQVELLQKQEFLIKNQRDNSKCSELFIGL